MRDSSADVPILFASAGPLKGKMWPVVSQLIIGRDKNCDVVIDDRQVSRTHAKIELVGNHNVQIKDNHSKNGTFVNGERIQTSKPLKDGDELKIALVQTFQFLSSDATIPLDQQVNIGPSSKTDEKNLTIFPTTREVRFSGQTLNPTLSDAQFRLLDLFFQNENKIVSRKEIVSHVWGSDAYAGVSEQAIDALVRRLRKRLEEINPNFNYIHTMRGVGFLFKNG